MSMTRRLSSPNDVRGCPGWYYGLRIQQSDGSVFFNVYQGERSIEGLRASRYRTTTLARRMGVRDLRGYEHVAREAIKTLEAASPAAGTDTQE